MQDILKPHVKLFQHQQIMLGLLEAHDSFALFAEQGTGKTLPTLVDLVERLLRQNVSNAIIVAPKPVMHSWRRDFNFFEEPIQELLEDRVTIINYDSVWRGKYDGTYDYIVLDESHAIKTPRAKRTKWALQSTLKAKVRRILTGTPIANSRLENLWAQYAFLKPVEWKGRTFSEDFGSHSRFLNDYCYLDRYFKPYMYKNVSKYQEIMDKRSYRITKEETLDLPEKMPDTIYEIDLKAKKPYKDMLVHSVIETLDLDATNALTKSLYLRQIASGNIKGEDGKVHKLGTDKPKVLKEFLEDYDQKLVIFFNFKSSKKDILEVLEKLKRKYVVLDGETKDKGVWQLFQTDPEVQVIVCQYQSANQGIDLFAASTTIYYEPTLSSNIMEQSRDRTHRIGQKNKCSYICFSTVGTVEPYIYKALHRHQDFTDQLFNEYIETHTIGRK